MPGFGDNRYSDEELVKAIQRVAKKIKRTPSHRVYAANKDEGEPSAPIIVARFGSWNNALGAAGLPLNKQPSSKAVAGGMGKAGFTDEQLLDAVQVAAGKVEVLTAAAYDKVKRKGDPSGSLIRSRLHDSVGGWTKIVERVGGRAGTAKTVARWRRR
jgi:Homing endonuclease associated repeat